MTNTELKHLKQYKILVEEKLGWAASGLWKQRDYLNLIALIEGKTGVIISLSTIKRIWKSGFEGTPQPATLDAFAQFIDYKNWLDFKKKYQLQPATVKSPGAAPKKYAFNYRSKMVHFSIVSIILSAVVAGVFLQSKTPSTVMYNPQDVAFSCNTSVTSGVPNTVIFDYDARKIQADSFFIQQSWNSFRREKILQSDKKHTSTYFYPGYHKAKLIANDSIVKEIAIKVNTIGWLALARFGYMDNTPTYIKDSDVQRNGELHVSSDHLNKHNVKIKKNVLIGYYYVNEFENVSSSNFSFETRMKLDSTFQLLCPHISILITGEGEMNAIPLTIKGCVGKVNLKIGDKNLSGKNNDLSGFGTDIYQWQEFKLAVIEKTAHIYLNQKFIMEVPFDEDIGNVSGFNINFSGTGSVDYVKLWDEKGRLVYGEDFE